MKNQVNKNDDIKIAICCIACQENAYIREWVEYYNKLGVDKIFIYDNNKSYEANEFFEDVINDYIVSEFVTIINKRDVINQGFQSICYNECYQRYSKDYDWMCFFDCDEFLSFSKFDNIKDFVSQDKFNDFHIIKINWLSYNDNDQIYKTEGTVQERFPNHSDITKEKIIWENRLLKSMVRGKGLIDLSKIYIGIHTPVPMESDGTILSVNISDGNYINKKHEIESSYKWDYRVCFADGVESFDLCYPNCFSPDFPRYDDAVIKHYRTKSCQEYIETKSRRGFQDCSKSILNIGTYFYFNEYSDEKMKYFVSDGRCELPNLLLDTSSTNLGDMMFTYAAAKYAIKDLPYEMKVYWKFNEFHIFAEMIKNTRIFNDVEIFPQTVLNDIKYSKNCTEFHYSVNPYPRIQYEYIPIDFDLGRNISIYGNRNNPHYFDRGFAYDLYYDKDIENHIKILYPFDYASTAAVWVDKNTSVSDLSRFFSIYTNHVTYIILFDNYEEIGSIVMDALIDSRNKTGIDLNIQWLSKPSPIYGRDVINLYFTSMCRVNFFELKNPIAWWGGYLNNTELCDIIIPYHDNEIYSLLLPENDARYKNLYAINV